MKNNFSYYHFFLTFSITILSSFFLNVSLYAAESRDFTMIDDSFVSVQLYAESLDIVAETSIHTVQNIATAENIQEETFIINHRESTKEKESKKPQGGGAKTYATNFPEHIKKQEEVIEKEEIFKEKEEVIEEEELFKEKEEIIGKESNTLNLSSLVQKKRETMTDVPIVRTIEGNKNNNKKINSFLLSEKKEGMLKKSENYELHFSAKDQYHKIYSLENTQECTVSFRNNFMLLNWEIWILLIFILGMCTQYILYKTFFVTETESEEKKSKNDK